MSDFLKKQLKSYYEAMGYTVGSIDIKGDEVKMKIVAPQALEFILVNVDASTGDIIQDKRNLQ